MCSTKAKTAEDIAMVRKFYEKDGLSLKAIAREMRYSINTVRKIIRRVHGYEGDKFDHEGRWQNVGKEYSAPEYTSDINGEILHLQKSETKDGYHRVNIGGLRETVHVHEAKKVYRLLNIPWLRKFIVHHINGNRSDCSSHNLSVFSNNNLHLQHHSRMEKSMHEFLDERDLLNQFYQKYPDLKLISITHHPFNGWFDVTPYKGIVTCYP